MNISDLIHVFEVYTCHTTRLQEMKLLIWRRTARNATQRQGFSMLFFTQGVIVVEGKDENESACPDDLSLECLSCMVISQTLRTK